MTSPGPDHGGADGVGSGATSRQSVVLVDRDDAPMGTSDKGAAHLPPGRLHRATSVFLFDGSGRTLLQRRAASKYHFAGCWANAACTHPVPGEAPLTSARRRLVEELGVVSDLRGIGTFRYWARDPRTGLVEHELDHVFVGHFVGVPSPNPAEVDGWSWVGQPELRDRVGRADPALAPWLVHAVRAFPSLVEPAAAAD